jgi:hypothetical protein
VFAGGKTGRFSAEGYPTSTTSARTAAVSEIRRPRASGFRLREGRPEQNQASGFGLQASGGQTRSAADHAELASRFGELIRGRQRLLEAFRPEA